VGESAVGVVHKAEDERLERVVALKVICAFDSVSSRRRFWQEARVAAQVVHPNACRIYDVAEEQDRLVLVMEFLDGECLTERIERGLVPAQEAVQIVLATLSALEAIHKMGIVHRDLKPSNVMLTASGTKLLDFGIAKLVTLNASNDAGATLADGTMPGTFLATPRYASPEQFQGQPVDARSDLFSLGVILFEMLTGQPPFPGKSVGETRAPWTDR
jgi:eukaryotic-like serine/threonine-protein kinase